MGKWMHTYVPRTEWSKIGGLDCAFHSFWAPTALTNTICSTKFCSCIVYYKAFEHPQPLQMHSALPSSVLTWCIWRLLSTHSPYKHNQLYQVLFLHCAFQGFWAPTALTNAICSTKFCPFCRWQNVPKTERLKGRGELTADFSTQSPCKHNQL